MKTPLYVLNIKVLFASYVSVKLQKEGRKERRKEGRGKGREWGGGRTPCHFPLGAVSLSARKSLASRSLSCL
jgi:hypothetical protein